MHRRFALAACLLTLLTLSGCDFITAARDPAPAIDSTGTPGFTSEDYRGIAPGSSAGDVLEAFGEEMCDFSWVEGEPLKVWETRTRTGLGAAYKLCGEPATFSVHLYRWVDEIDGSIWHYEDYDEMQSRRRGSQMQFPLVHGYTVYTIFILVEDGVVSDIYHYQGLGG